MKNLKFYNLKNYFNSNILNLFKFYFFDFSNRIVIFFFILYILILGIKVIYGYLFHFLYIYNSFPYLLYTIGVVYGFVLTSISINKYINSDQYYIFFTLPVNRIDILIVNIMIFGFIYFIINYLMAFLHFFILCFLSNSLNNFFKLFFSSSKFFNSILLILFFHSIYLLGSITIKKNSFLITTFILFIVILIISTIGFIIVKNFFIEIEFNITNILNLIDIKFYRYISIFLKLSIIGLTILFYTFSYQELKNKNILD